MRHDDVPDDLKRLAFDFFYWFSRFEFALKEAGFLKSTKKGAKAEANWAGFIAKYSSVYVLTAAGQALIVANPQRQIVSGPGELTFGDVSTAPASGQLERVVELARAVRNNLFHGGKHGDDYWDEPARMEMLLKTTIKVLGELAEMADLQEDYKRYY
ncbi:MAG: hypothetical protein ACM3W4_04515 [Ignavibacteriales bacterium]